MNISSQVIEVLDSVCEKFGIAIDWSQQNVLPYLEDLSGKYIKYEIVTSIAWIIFFSLAIIASIKGTKNILKSRQSENYFFEGDEEVGSIFILILATVVIVGCIGITTQILDVITCCTFPEKIILEFLKGILSKAK